VNSNLKTNPNQSKQPGNNSRGLLCLSLLLASTMAGICAEPRASHNVTEFGPFVANATDPKTVAANSETINKALDKMGKGGGGEVVLPAGIFYVAPTRWEISEDGKAAAIHIRYDHLTLRGAGIGKTVLRTRSEWSVVDHKVVRGAGIRINGSYAPAWPRHDITLKGFELDGGAGFTGKFGWPASIKDGDGWDITHKGIILSWDDFVDDVTLDSIYVHDYRGEVIYAGGGGLGKVRLHRVTSASTNASTFNITADFVAEDCEFGKSRFWVEIGTRFEKKAGTFRRCHFHDASVIAIVLCQGDGKPQPYLFEDCTFENTPGVFGIFGGVGGPVTIRHNIFTNAGDILSSSNAGGTTNDDNKNVLMEDNQATRSEALVSLSGKATDWTIRKNTFVGRDAANPGLSTAVFYGTAKLHNCVIEDNQFSDCRTPEQTAPMFAERPLFQDNTYTNVERRSTHGTFCVAQGQPIPTPHFEEITLTAGTPAAPVELETKAYPDGQELLVKGGSPDAPVKFVPKAASYTVKTTRVLNGTRVLWFKYSKQESKWIEMPAPKKKPAAAGGVKADEVLVPISGKQ